MLLVFCSFLPTKVVPNAVHNCKLPLTSHPPAGSTLNVVKGTKILYANSNITKASQKKHKRKGKNSKSIRYCISGVANWVCVYLWGKPTTSHPRRGSGLQRSLERSRLPFSVAFNLQIWIFERTRVVIRGNKHTHCTLFGVRYCTLTTALHQGFHEKLRFAFSGVFHEPTTATNFK